MLSPKSDYSRLSETLNRLLPGEQYKRIREGIMAAADYSGVRTDRLRQSIDETTRLRTGILVNGTLVLSSDTQAILSGWSWVIDFAVQQPDGPVTITVLPEDSTYPRPDYFIGLADGSIAYRPSTIDQFGNSIPPAVEADEVLLRIIQRNPDGSTTEQAPEAILPDFSDKLYQTEAAPDTVGKYAKVWQGQISENGNYQLHLAYGAPSSELDWETGASAKSGYLVLNFYAHQGIPITGIQFYTVDPASEEGDWVFQRIGTELALYHKSSNFWMRVYFRALFHNLASLQAGLLNGQPYQPLPGPVDQEFSSIPLATGNGSQNQLQETIPSFLSPGSFDDPEWYVDLMPGWFFEVLEDNGNIISTYVFVRLDTSDPLNPQPIYFRIAYVDYNFVSINELNVVQPDKLGFAHDNLLLSTGSRYLSIDASFDSTLNSSIQRPQYLGASTSPLAVLFWGVLMNGPRRYSYFVVSAQSQQNFNNKEFFIYNHANDDIILGGALEQDTLFTHNNGDYLPGLPDQRIFFEEEVTIPPGKYITIRLLKDASGIVLFRREHSTATGTGSNPQTGLNFSDKFTVTDGPTPTEKNVDINTEVMATRDYVDQVVVSINTAAQLYMFNNY